MFEQKAKLSNEGSYRVLCFNKALMDKKAKLSNEGRYRVLVEINLVFEDKVLAFICLISVYVARG